MLYKAPYEKKFRDLLEESGEIGFVESTSHPIVAVRGLPKAFPNEVVIFESGEIGLVQSMDSESVEVLVVSKEAVRVGAQVTRTGKGMEVPVGEELLGHTIDPLGFPLFGSTKFDYPKNFRPIDTAPTGIDSRAVVK